MFPFGSCAGISGRFGLAVQQRRLVSLIRTGQSIWKKKWWSKSQSRLVFIWTKKKKKERDSRSCYFQRWAQLVGMCKIKKTFLFQNETFFLLQQLWEKKIWHRSFFSFLFADTWCVSFVQFRRRRRGRFILFFFIFLLCWEITDQHSSSARTSITPHTVYIYDTGCCCSVDDIDGADADHISGCRQRRKSNHLSWFFFVFWNKRQCFLPERFPK